MAGLTLQLTPDRPHPGINGAWSPGDPFPRVPQWTVDRIYACLQMADELCARLGVPYTAYSGTLLGAVRHGGMIPWDTDGDLGIRVEDLPAIRDSQGFLAKRGFGLGRDRAFATFKIYPLDGYKIRPWNEYRFPWVDLFPLRRRGDRFTYASAKARRTWPNEYLESDVLDTLRRYRFGPLALSAPPESVTLEYLTRFYGPTWRTEAHVSRVPDRRGTATITLASFPPALPSSGAMEKGAGHAQ